MTRDVPWLVAAASVAAIVLASSRAQAVTRCDVMAHAQQWLDAGVMYSQGPGGGYCPGDYYCDPSAGGQCYRPDCSGFVSAVWGLPPPGHVTYSFAGGPWDDGVSHVISASELAPGDALNYPGDPNQGTGHIMLFGGWLDSNGKLWAYQENLCGTPANYTERNWNEMAGAYLPIRLNTIEECAPPRPDMQPFRRRALVDVNGDGKGDVCGRASDAIYCVVLDESGSATQVQGPAFGDAGGWDQPQYATTIQYADVNGDGKADVCARDSNGILCGLSDGKGFPTTIMGPGWSDAGGWTFAQYYSTIQLADVDGDGKADVCARGAAGIGCALSDGEGFPTMIPGPAWEDAAGWDQPQYYSTIQFADVNGDGKADLCARDSTGIVCALSDGKGFPTTIRGPEWGDAGGWNQPQYYSTIQFADIDGDGKADVCGRDSIGIGCALSDGAGFPTMIPGPAWGDAGSWNQPQYYRTIQFADVDGDGKADVCARDSIAFSCALFDGKALSTPVAGPAWGDAEGWNQPQYYSTIRVVDIDQDGKADLCGRDSNGIGCFLSDGKAFSTAIAGPGWSDAFGWNQPQYFSTLTFLGTAAPKSIHDRPGETTGGTHNGAVSPGGSAPDSYDVTGSCSVAAPFGRGSKVPLLLGATLALSLVRRRARGGRVVRTV